MTADITPGCVAIEGRTRIDCNFCLEGPEAGHSAGKELPMKWDNVKWQ
jgi:hypothetical protein